MQPDRCEIFQCVRKETVPFFKSLGAIVKVFVVRGRLAELFVEEGKNLEVPRFWLWDFFLAWF